MIKKLYITIIISTLAVLSSGSNLLAADMIFLCNYTNGIEKWYEDGKAEDTTSRKPLTKTFIYDPLTNKMKAKIFEAKGYEGMVPCHKTESDLSCTWRHTGPRDEYELFVSINRLTLESRLVDTQTTIDDSGNYTIGKYNGTCKIKQQAF